jgi:hypothetical protein
MVAYSLAVGLPLIMGVAIWLAVRSAHSNSPATSWDQETIWEIERRTIHDLLTAELVAQRQDTTARGHLGDRQDAP